MQGLLWVEVSGSTGAPSVAVDRGPAAGGGRTTPPVAASPAPAAMGIYSAAEAECAARHDTTARDILESLSDDLRSAFVEWLESRFNGAMLRSTLLLAALRRWLTRGGMSHMLEVRR